MQTQSETLIEPAIVAGPRPAHESPPLGAPAGDSTPAFNQCVSQVAKHGDCTAGRAGIARAFYPREKRRRVERRLCEQLLMSCHCGGVTQ